MNVSGLGNVGKRVKGFADKVRPKLLTMYNKTKELGKDTVEFAKKNPKKLMKVGVFAATSALFIAGVVKMFKAMKEKSEQNQIMSQIINHQRNHINDLKEHIAGQNEIIATKDSVLEASK